MIKKLFAITMISVICMGLLCGCKLPENWWENLPKVPTFEEKCVTTEDGFVYYVDYDIGLCLIDVPENEEVIIPEYIDDMPIMQLGYVKRGLSYLNEHYLNGNHVKKLTMQHMPNCENSWFNCLETLVYIDILYIYSDIDIEILEIPDFVGRHAYYNKPDIELINGDKEVDLEEINITTILIPEYVTKIEAGVFEGLKDVTIKTSYTSQPEGWEDGWNGDCIVEWGAEI